MAAVINDYRNGLSFTGGGPTDNTTLSVVQCLGGRYAFAAAAASWAGGNVDLQMYMPDTTTLVSVLTAPLSANGNAIVDLPTGKYAIVITTTTGVMCSLCPVPTRNT